MEWNVKNAINRDVERQHLNKILADIRQAVSEATIIAQRASSGNVYDAIGSMVEGNTETGIQVTYDLNTQKLDFRVNSFSIRLEGDVEGSGEVRNLGSVVIQTEIDKSLLGIPEAPMDGYRYVRRTGQWDALSESSEALDNVEGIGFLHRGLSDTGRVVWTTDKTTDQLPEGTTNLYFSDERAQDAIALALTDSDTIEFIYDDVANTITANYIGPMGGEATNLLGYKLVDENGDFLVDDEGNFLVDDNETLYWDLIEDTPTTIDDYGITDVLVRSVVAGTGITVDNTDPENPIVSATPYSLDPDLSSIAALTTTGYLKRTAPNTWTLSEIPTLPAYTLGTLPSATPAWQMIVVTDLTGGAEPCFSDGTDWRRFSDRSVAS